MNYALVFKGHRDSLWGVKWPGGEVDHSSQSSSEVKTKCSSTSTPLVYFHSVDSDSFAVLEKRVTVPGIETQLLDCKSWNLFSVLT